MFGIYLIFLTVHLHMNLVLLHLLMKQLLISLMSLKMKRYFLYLKSSNLSHVTNIV